MKLTESNYRTMEADMFYWSNSQYKDFLECEARALAKARREFVEDDNEALLLGQYVHCGVLEPHKLPEFMERNKDSMLTKGRTAKDGTVTGQEIRAPFALGADMIARVKRDELCMDALSGKHEHIFTFELAGLPWKAKLDSVDYERGVIADLKTCRDFDATEWNEALRVKVPWYEVYGYWTQFAVYRQAYKECTGVDSQTCVIVAVSKQKPPDIAILAFEDESRFQYELDKIADNMARLEAVKRGKEPARRCEKCAYCRSTKIVTEIQPALSFYGAI